MIIQSAPPGEKRFVCTMVQHLDLCEQFVRAFGNDEFERPEPFDEVVYTVGHHDRGWDDIDAHPILHPASGFPCGIGTGPVPGGFVTTRQSPDFNQARHAYCGLLASMHSWGLYRDRYGFTEFHPPGGGTSIPIPPPHKDKIEALLEAEIDRQKRLTAELSADPGTAGWVEEKPLMRNYKILQFMDTLALYFNLSHRGARGEERFVHVPKSGDEDATVTMRPIGGDDYAVSPFPFAGDALEARCTGRYVEPIADGTEPDDYAATIFSQPESQQTYRLIRG